jgi:hypothetical protein
MSRKVADRQQGSRAGTAKKALEQKIIMTPRRGEQQFVVWQLQETMPVKMAAKQPGFYCKTRIFILGGNPW